jgi:ribonuclease HI
LQLAPGDSTVSVVAPKGRHTRSTPQLPLETPEADPENIIKKGKTSQEGISTVVPGDSGNLHDSSFKTPVAASNSPFIPSVGVSRSLDFEIFPVELPPSSLHLEGESFDTPVSPDIVKWFRPRSLEDFPTLGFPTPPPIKVVVSKEGETYFPLNPILFSSNTQSFPFSPRNTAPVLPVQTPSPPGSPTIHIPMAGANPPRNRMDAIVAARYAPLVLPQPMNSLPAGDYLKYMPKFTGEEDITAEEHLSTFYSYADNHNIENEDVWMRVFVQSLDGEARKWFRGLTPGSIDGIEALDDSFLRHWGDKKYFLYYITEFGSLKREEGESVSDFSKRFNKMYNKIPTEINPTETSAKITYASAFDPEFCLLLRERRATSLAHMQDATLEVESNILAADKLRSKYDRDRRRGRSEASTSDSSAAHPQVDELTKLVKSLSAEMEKLKFEGRQSYRNPQNVDNRGNFRRPNNSPQIIQRDQRNRDRDDKKIQAPLQNNLVTDEEGEEEDVDPEIHCLGDTSSSPHLTQSAYEEALMGSQLNELSKGERTSGNPNRYNLRSKKKEGKPDIPDQPTRTENPVKSVAASSKEKEAQNPQAVVKSPTPEVKEILKPPSSFSFENEIQKIKIPVPFLELVKNEDFKRYLSKMLQPEPSSHPTDSVNLQDEKPVVILGPLVEDRDDSSPPFYTSLNIHDKVLHNCLMDSGASHNLMPKTVMDELGLEVTKTYHDLYSFDSRKVKCLGVIKDLVVSLFQLPMKSVVMDIVVVDVPPKFGMLLSRSWIKRLGGTLQMDLSYATIPVFGGEHRRIYREAQLAYIISDEANPTNHPIFAVDTDLGTSMLQLIDAPQTPIEIRKNPIASCENPPPNTSVWKMFFDGASSRESVGVGVVFISPAQETISLSYKLEFEATNNVAEYEALVLGLRAAKDMKIEELAVFGDVELIVHQVRNRYQAKHPRLRAYRNEVWDLVDSFFLDFNISFVPREENTVEDSLVVSASKFRVPLPPKLKYEVEVKYRPSIPDNVKHWKVFEDDLEIKSFLRLWMNSLLYILIKIKILKKSLMLMFF